MHFGAVDRAQAAGGLIAGEDVLGDREQVEQAALLIHDADSHLLGAALVGDLDRASLELDDAGIGRIDSGEDVHERAFARPVFADEGVDLALPHFEIYRGERAHSGKCFGDAGAAKQSGHRRITSPEAADS